MYSNSEKVRRGEDKEVNLLHMLYKILLNWRWVIVSMLIFAILLGGIKYITDIKNLKESNILNKQTTEELSDSLTDEQQQDVLTAQWYHDQIEERQKYQLHSIRMNLNAYAIDVVVLQYYVDSQTASSSSAMKNYTRALIDYYEVYIYDNGFLNDLQLDWAVEESYISELVSVTTGNNNIYLTANANRDDVIVTNNGETFTIYIMGRDRDSAKELADAVGKSIDQYQGVLCEEIGDHRLSLINRYESILVDTALANEQTSMVNVIVDLQSRLNKLTDNFTGTQLQVLADSVIVDIDMPELGWESEQIQAQKQVSFNLKYFLTGAFIGLCLACLWITIRYILSGKIKETQELQDNYGLRILGTLGRTVDKKESYLSFIDRCIDKLMYREEWTVEEQWQLITANVSVMCRKKEIKNIFVTTSLHMSEQDKAVLERLVKEFESVGLCVTIGENIIRNVDSFEKMVNAGNAIILEKLENTRYTALEQELTICIEQEANVLGVIVLES